MPKTGQSNYSFSLKAADIKKIDPSLYQHRKYFDENSLKELGKSIFQDGLIEPIILRPQQKGRF